MNSVNSGHVPAGDDPIRLGDRLLDRSVSQVPYWSLLRRNGDGYFQVVRVGPAGVSDSGAVHSVSPEGALRELRDVSDMRRQLEAVDPDDVTSFSAAEVLHMLDAARSAAPGSLPATTETRVEWRTVVTNNRGESAIYTAHGRSDAETFSMKWRDRKLTTTDVRVERREITTTVSPWTEQDGAQA